MMTSTDTPMWLRTYQEHQRNREYALSDAARNDLEILWDVKGDRAAVARFIKEIEEQDTPEKCKLPITP